MTTAQLAMFGAAGCYVVAAIAYYAEGKSWMAATVAMFATTCITVWMAGTK